MKDYTFQINFLNENNLQIANYIEEKDKQLFYDRKIKKIEVLQVKVHKSVYNDIILKFSNDIFLGYTGISTGLFTKCGNTEFKKFTFPKGDNYLDIVEGKKFRDLDIVNLKLLYSDNLEMSRCDKQCQIKIKIYFS